MADVAKLTDEEKKRKSDLLDKMTDHAVFDMLQKRPVYELDEFDRDLFAWFAADAMEWRRGRRGGGRDHFHNLVDWVNAHLTRARAIQYIRRGGKRYVVYLPLAGNVNGVWLIDSDRMVTVLRELQKLPEQEGGSA